MADQIVKVKIDLDVTEFNKNAKAMSAALSGVLGRDVELFNGKIAKTAKLVQQSEAAMKGATAAATAAGNSVKKSNQQWTNLALVVQDLPYGFRGIQNNLPALMGGIAGMSGVFYLVGSAVIALFTAWDAGLFKTTNAISILDAANKEYADSAKQAAGNAGEEISKINALTTAAANQGLAMSKRLAAVKQLQDEYPAYFGNLSKEQILNGDVATSVDKVKSAIIERAKATAVASKINKLAAEKFVQEERLYQLALQKTFKIQQAIAYVNKMKAAGFDESSKHLQGLIDAQIGGIREEENTIKSTVNTIDKELARLDGIYAASTAASADLKTGNMPDKAKAPKIKKEKVDTFNILDATKKFYDAKLNFAEGDEAAQKDILLREKQTFDQLIDANQISYQDYYTNVSSIYKQLIDFQIREDKRLYDSQVKFADERINQVQATLGVEMKLNKNNIAAQQEAIKKAMAVYAALAMTSYNPEAILKYGEAFNKLSDQLSSFKDIAQQIGEILKNSLTSGIEELGKSIGESLATGTFDFSGLATILADSLISIGKALIAYALLSEAAIEAMKNPLSWPLALGAGLLAIAAGSFLKSKLSEQKTAKFANGGIVSGPTMGLMGEYPGAANNPEVIAPLDKLKDMIGSGGGGGTFMLRGQDLLLSVNRAQKASNLKGQNISLA